MVRVNIINPRALADQHLIAEYLEIIMLRGYVKKYPNSNLDKISKDYILGPGHILFFKNKLNYLKGRHEELTKEMKKRGFNVNKKLNISTFPIKLKKNWKPMQKDKEIIKERLIWKINKKPDFYRYYGERKPKEFFRELIKNA